MSSLLWCGIVFQNTKNDTILLLSDVHFSEAFLNVYFPFRPPILVVRGLYRIYVPGKEEHELWNQTDLASKQGKEVK